MKNFQLCHHSSPDLVLLQLGRIDTNVFNMDFRFMMMLVLMVMVLMCDKMGKRGNLNVNDDLSVFFQGTIVGTSGFCHSALQLWLENRLRMIVFTFSLKTNAGWRLFLQFGNKLALIRTYTYTMVDPSSTIMNVFAALGWMMYRISSRQQKRDKAESVKSANGES